MRNQLGSEYEQLLKKSEPKSLQQTLPPSAQSTERAAAVYHILERAESNQAVVPDIHDMANIIITTSGSKDEKDLPELNLPKVNGVGASGNNDADNKD